MDVVEVKNKIKPKQVLLEELARRCKQNPRYSLRAFAKSIGLTPAGLSLILSGKRGLTQKTASRLAKNLGFDPRKTQAFLNGSLKSKSFVNDVTNDYEQIGLDEFAMIAEWYHFAILSLLDLEDFSPSVSWISSRLEISIAETKTAIERLVRLGILDTKGSKWKQVKGPIMVENKVSTSATRQHQKQVLEKALTSLENDAMETRNISSVTLAMDPDLVGFAAEEIRKFRISLMEILEKKSKKKREVYHLALQIYPVSKKKV